MTEVNAGRGAGITARDLVPKESTRNGKRKDRQPADPNCNAEQAKEKSFHKVKGRRPVANRNRRVLAVVLVGILQRPAQGGVSQEVKNKNPIHGVAGFIGKQVKLPLVDVLKPGKAKEDEQQQQDPPLIKFERALLHIRETPLPTLPNRPPGSFLAKHSTDYYTLALVQYAYHPAKLLKLRSMPAIDEKLFP